MVLRNNITHILTIVLTIFCLFAPSLFDVGRCEIHVNTEGGRSHGPAGSGWSWGL